MLFRAITEQRVRVVKRSKINWKTIMYDYDISEKFFGLFQKYKDTIDKLNKVHNHYEKISKLIDISKSVRCMAVWPR